MDWYPSVLELCGVKQDSSSSPLDGRSVVPIVNDAKAPSSHDVLHFAWANNWAVRKGDWKLIGKLDAKISKVAFSLHNLAESNPEVKDHSQEQPELVKELLALHEVWEKDVKAK